MLYALLTVRIVDSSLRHVFFDISRQVLLVTTKPKNPLKELTHSRAQFNDLVPVPLRFDRTWSEL